MAVDMGCERSDEGGVASEETAATTVTGQEDESSVEAKDKEKPTRRMKKEALDSRRRQLRRWQSLNRQGMITSDGSK